MKRSKKGFLVIAASISLMVFGGFYGSCRNRTTAQQIPPVTPPAITLPTPTTLSHMLSKFHLRDVTEHQTTLFEDGSVQVKIIFEDGTFTYVYAQCAMPEWGCDYVPNR